jgi:hypothetical protein
MSQRHLSIPRTSRRFRSRTVAAAAVAALALTAAAADAGIATEGTTTAVAPASYSVFGSTVPVNAAEPDSASVELGVKFSSSTDGWVKGIRFYKSQPNTSTPTRTGKLWSSTGALLGSVAFAAETASGWQQATFATPIKITSGQQYTASYRAPVGTEEAVE